MFQNSVKRGNRHDTKLLKRWSVAVDNIDGENNHFGVISTLRSMETKKIKDGAAASNYSLESKIMRSNDTEMLPVLASSDLLRHNFSEFVTFEENILRCSIIISFV